MITFFLVSNKKKIFFITPSNHVAICKICNVISYAFPYFNFPTKHELSVAYFQLMMYYLSYINYKLETTYLQ